MGAFSFWMMVGGGVWLGGLLMICLFMRGCRLNDEQPDPQRGI